MLSDRKKKILQVVIDDYITSASPVSSKAIHEAHIDSLSPATIRSELKSLEELGFLTHPHTSAGRIPTSLAYKHYVENIAIDSKMTEDELQELKGYFATNVREAEYVASSAVKVLTDMTNYTSVANLSKEKDVIQGVRLMPVSQSVLVLIVVFTSGKVTDHRIYGNFTKDDAFIKTAEDILNKHVAGKQFEQLSELEQVIYEEFGIYKTLCNQIFEALTYEVMKRDRLLLMGENKIFEQPEYNNVENVKDFLAVVSSQEKMSNLIKSSVHDDISVNVMLAGEGDGLPKDCSLVTASYKIGEKDFGTYGVIGPARMDYNKVVKVLNGIRDILVDIVDEKDE